MILRFLYNYSVLGYSLLVRVASLFSRKARLWTKGREDWRRRLSEGMKKSGNQKVAWFHAASLGEFEQGRPVIEAFRKEFPDYFILLTFFSPSGYEIRKNYSEADFICYLPADTVSNTTNFVEIVKPAIVFFIKYEFWVNYLRTLRQKGTVIISFAAIFRPNQVFFKKWGEFYRSILSCFDAILVQDERSFHLLKGVKDVQCVEIAGDTRFDRVAQLVYSGRELPEIKEFVAGNPCLIVGSAWAQDMAVVIPVLNRLGTGIKAVIAPHEIRADEMMEWQNQLNLPSILYSEYKNRNFVLSEPQPAYLIIDNIGMLSSLYRYGTMAYVGGAFGKGLHNTLEAATYGMPVFFGNRNYEKFSEAVGLIEAGVARAVGNEEELYTAVAVLLDDNQILRAKSTAAQNYVLAHTGATEKVMNTVRRLLLSEKN